MPYRWLHLLAPCQPFTSVTNAFPRAGHAPVLRPHSGDLATQAVNWLTFFRAKYAIYARMFDARDARVRRYRTVNTSHHLAQSPSTLNRPWSDHG